MFPVRPIIVAHRGLHTHAAENSMDAFVAAADAGISWVECDVWPSMENAAVVIHDPTLQRTTGKPGEVRHQTADQLGELGVPSLKQLVAELNKHNAPGLLVEIKPRINRPFVASVLKTLFRYEGMCMVQSFHDDNIVRAWGIDNGMNTAILVESREDLAKAVERGWPFINAHHSVIDQELVDRLHSTGQRIGAWTVNQPDDISRMIQLGIDMLITDEPELAKQIATRSP
jgi:glycerophosphoryl diester phosphodiesterase